MAKRTSMKHGVLDRSSAPMRVGESKRESLSDVTAMSQVARISALAERAQAWTTDF
jgi:hypothetical protein